MDVTLERVLSLIPHKPDGKYVHGAKKDFCVNIGAPTNIVNEWERGVSKSYNNYLYAIAAKYNVSVDWLMGNTDEKSPSPVGDELDETTRAIFAEIDSMESDEDKLLALEMIRAIKRRREK